MSKTDYPRPPQLVMFDLDGTLVDSVPDLSAALDEMLLDLGYPSAGEYKARLWVGNGASTLVQRALADALRVPPGEVSPDLQRHCLQNFLQRYEYHNGRSAQLFPGVQQALQLLQAAAVTMAVVTNKPARFVPHLLQSLQIEDYFRISLGGDALPVKKPHPGPLRHVLAACNLTAQQALMVGDSVNDIEAARAASVDCVAVIYGYNHGRPVEEHNPDWLTDNLGEFFRSTLAPVAS